MIYRILYIIDKLPVLIMVLICFTGNLLFLQGACIMSDLNARFRGRYILKTIPYEVFDGDGSVHVRHVEDLSECEMLSV